jgi:transcriptional regulator GlxA family with amidase domain
MDTHPVRRSPDPRIQPSFAFIQANLHERILLTDLARLSGLSAARYSHLFALSTGMTPGKYIRALREYHAAKVTRSQPEAPSRSLPARRHYNLNRGSD